MPIMNWNDTLDVGIEEMNDEHKGILDAMNAIYDRAQEGVTGDEIDALVAKLGEVTVQHFADEEAFMQKTGFPEFETHKRLHTKLLDRFGKEAAAIKEAGGVVSDDFFNFLRFWLGSHIRGIDHVLVATADLEARLAGMREIDPAVPVDGKPRHAAAPLLEEPDRPWKDAALSQYPRQGGRLMGYSMRTDRYHLVRWVNKGDRDGEPVAVELVEACLHLAEALDATVEPVGILLLPLHGVDAHEVGVPARVAFGEFGEALPPLLGDGVAVVRAVLSPGEYGEREIPQPKGRRLVGMAGHHRGPCEAIGHPGRQLPLRAADCSARGGLARLREFEAGLGGVAGALLEHAGQGVQDL